MAYVFRNKTETRQAPPRALVDARGLEAALRGQIAGEVRFDDGSRALYATDASNYRQVPIGVVIPKSIEDVVNTVAIARRFGAPLLARGGGTSLAGQCCNVAVVMDFSKYLNRILELDPEHKHAVVQPGLVLDTLRGAASKHHLTFAPDPSTHTHCTLGGMIGNNSCGRHSVMGGKTDDNVEELEILTYDGLRMRVGATSDTELAQIIQEGGRRGEIYAQLKAFRDKYADLIRQRYPDIPRRVSGYNLIHLLPEHGFHVARALVGSESTCVVVLEARTRLVDDPPVRSLVVLGYPDVYDAGRHVPQILEYGPIALEGLDDVLIHDMKKVGLHPHDITLVPPGSGWLMVEFGGESKEESDARARRMMDALKKEKHPPSMKLFDDPREERMLWRVREAGLGATAHVPGSKITWEGWEDAAVPPDKVGDYLKDFRALLNQYGYACSLYGHFGQGCVHTRIDFDLETHDGIRTFRAFLHDAARLVVRYGGSLSGEHGDGQSKAEMLPIMYGDELVQAFREFKAIWDPEGRMNPGKIVDPYRPDENLRLGADYRPPQPMTHFHYTKDEGNFPRATLRCVGVGECRRHEGGTMCPSYRVTREEKHSTRGRARLLFEMLQGEVITGGWKDEHVRDALDLCLSCKGCKGDCPVNVDMATYKAEFLSHYYAGRLRPLQAYSMGLIHWWSRLAARMPSLVNFITQTPGLSALAKRLGGFAPQRQIPVYAAQTFKDWFIERGPKNAGKPQVLVWPDTFTNHFHPETGKAAVEVLEAAGYQVVMPAQSLCCGLPLFAYGMLDTAKDLLREVLTALRPQISAGIPLIGLEPSCTTVFRDELIELFPFDEDAKRLSGKTFTFAEFLDKEARDFTLPRLPRRAIVHGHCHQKAVIGMQSEVALLKKMGLDAELLDDGCCGMAGNFGFEHQHYAVSRQVGEYALLPRVRETPKDSLVIADGFSCREQIRQDSDRHALHIAEIVRMAMAEDRAGLAAPYPERALVEARRHDFEAGQHRLKTAAYLGAGVMAAGGIALWWLRGRAAAQDKLMQ